MIQVELKDKNTVELNMKGEVTAGDYQRIKPKLEKLFKEHGKMKFLIILDDLKKFTLGAAYEDIKFDLQNLKDVGTTAIVGNKTNQALLTKFINVIFPEKVEFFESKNLKGALKWLSHY